MQATFDVYKNDRSWRFYCERPTAFTLNTTASAKYWTAYSEYDKDMNLNCQKGIAVIIGVNSHYSTNRKDRILKLKCQKMNEGKQ